MLETSLNICKLMMSNTGAQFVDMRLPGSDDTPGTSYAPTPSHERFNKSRSLKSSPKSLRLWGLRGKKAQQTQIAQLAEDEPTALEEELVAKAAEEERAAKAAKKAEETRRLALAVNDHIRERRMSHETGQEMEEEESAQTIAQAKRERLRRSRLASPLVSSEDVTSINSYVQKREEERAERQRTDAATTDSAAHRWQIAAEEIINKIESWPLPSEPSPNVAVERASARERMAQMQREADERKKIAQAETESEARSSNARSKASAHEVGTAKAAAKVAGGVFYTFEEHVRE